MAAPEQPLASGQADEAVSASTTMSIALALREWAVVCDALALGHQQILLRKGGIHEPDGAGRFEPRAQPFGLFPTRLHQRAEDLKDAHARQLAQPPPHWGDGTTAAIRHVATALAVFQCTSLDELGALDDLHIYSRRAIVERFNFRRPALWVIALRVFDLAEGDVRIWSLEDRDRLCSSWLESQHSDQAARPRLALPPALLQPEHSAPEVALLARLDRTISAGRWFAPTAGD